MSPKIRNFLIALTLLICALVLCTQSVSADQTNDSDKYTFANYGGEEFTPEPMEFGANLVDETAPVVSEYNETERKHMYLQFYSNPNLDQREMLEDYGVQFIRGIGIYAFIVSMPADLTAADLPIESGLRWMGEIPVENKYDRYLGLAIPEWAWTEDGNVELWLDFYEDVTYEEAQMIADKYSTSSPIYSNYPYSPDCFITTNKTNISIIVGEDLIQGIGFPEEEIFNEESSPGFQFLFSALMILCAMLYYRKN